MPLQYDLIVTSQFLRNKSQLLHVLAELAMIKIFHLLEIPLGLTGISHRKFILVIVHKPFDPLHLLFPTLSCITLTFVLGQLSFQQSVLSLEHLYLT